MNRLRHIALSIYRAILFPVVNNPVFFLFTVLVSAELLVIGNLYSDHTNWFLGTLLPLFDGYLYCVLASLLRPLHLRFIPWVLYSFISLGEAFSILCYHAQYTMRVLQLVMLTTPQETSEFLSSTIHTPAPWLAIGLLMLCALLAWGLHWLHRRFTPQLALRIWHGLIFVFLIWSAIREVPQYIRVCRSFSEPTTALLGDHRHLPQLSSCHVRLSYAVAFNYVSAGEIDYLVQTVRNTQISACSHTCPTIVLMLGESYSKYHTPLYVPDYPSVSPYLCALRDSGYLYVHEQAVSVSNLTSVVMRQLFSTAGHLPPAESVHHSLFPRVFRQAGYHVYFLSNQFTLSYEDTWTRVGGTIFNQSELSQLQFDYRNPSLHRYDEGLINDLPPMDSLLAQPSLLIFHVMGQHVGYDERYPIERAHFAPDDVHPAYGGAHAREITAAYDNATLYNDSVIAALWSRFATTDAIGIYLSDHGEEVFDYRNFYERSDIDRLSPEGVRYQLDIPMMFLVTDSFRQLHPELFASIQNCLDRPFINNRLSHLLFHLAGIDYVDYSPQLDLLSPTYDTIIRH